jgi:hypothetical protein
VILLEARTGGCAAVGWPIPRFGSRRKRSIILKSAAFAPTAHAEKPLKGEERERRRRDGFRANLTFLPELREARRAAPIGRRTGRGDRQGVGLPNNIVAFVGQNENNALAVACRDVMNLMKPLGYAGHVINLLEPQWERRLSALVNEGVAFAWGNAGVGAKLAINGKSFWDALRLPFISILADQPAWMPTNHRVPARFVVNGYVFREYLEVQRRFIRSPQVSTLVPHGLVPNPHGERTPWAKRTHRMVFLKSGGDPEALRTEWTTWPVRLRAILEDICAEALKRPTGDINDLALDCFRSHGIELGERHDLYFAVVQKADLYIRQARATLMAKALCRVPADIIGARWDHIDHSGSCARFHPPIDAGAVAELLADTQYVVNTTPNFGSGSHERIPNGFAARACVVSDDNDYTRTTFGELPTYFGFDWTDPDWAERLIERFEDDEDFSEATQPAFELGAREFDGTKFMGALIEIAQMMRFGEQTGRPFAYDAAA